MDLPGSIQHRERLAQSQRLMDLWADMVAEGLSVEEQRRHINNQIDLLTLHSHQDPERTGILRASWEMLARELARGRR